MTEPDTTLDDGVATVHYDHYSPEFTADPHRIWADLRHRCPVAHSPAYGGFFVLSKHEDIDRVYHEPHIFSSFPADTPPDPGHQNRLIPMEMDPPEHRDYRRVIDPWFGPKRMKTLEPGLRAAAQALIDVMVERRAFDFVELFALPYPCSAFLSLFGLPPSVSRDMDLCRWTDQVVHADGATPNDVGAHLRVRHEAGRALRAFLTEVLAARKNDPGDDAVSFLLEARYAGERPLTDHEIVNFMQVLVLGGLDTVTAALAFSFFHLARRADLQDKLAADHTLIPAAVEEMLRYEATVHPSRTVTQDCVIRGVHLRAGDRVILPLASGNRDEDVFEDPDEIRLDRQVNRHLAFGAGNHRCLGSHLARLELRIAFEELFARIPQFSVPADTELVVFGGQTRSVKALPFRTWRE
jgi:cytochrome P450